MSEPLKPLRRRLQSMEHLRSIVTTMRALSAASIRQYEQAVAALRSYELALVRGLQVVMRDTRAPPSPLRPAEPARVAGIVFGSDHGLCGRFNEQVADYARAHMARYQGSEGSPLLMAMGARLAATLETEGLELEEPALMPSSAAQITLAVQHLLLTIDGWTESRDIGELWLFYNQHVRGKGHSAMAIRLLPIDLEALHAKAREPWPSRSLPSFTMGPALLLRRLLRQHLFLAIFRAFAESLASEHASRLTAMQSAEHNLQERLEELRLLLGRAHQRAITSELLDIVSGFEATAEKEGSSG